MALNTEIIGSAISYMYPDADPVTDYIVMDLADGNGAFIKEWNLEAAKPTDEELTQAYSAFVVERTLKVELQEIEERVPRSLEGLIPLGNDEYLKTLLQRKLEIINELKLRG